VPALLALAKAVIDRQEFFLRRRKPASLRAQKNGQGVLELPGRNTFEARKSTTVLNRGQSERNAEHDLKRKVV